VLLAPRSVVRSNFLKRHEIVSCRALPLKIQNVFFPTPLHDHLWKIKGVGPNRFRHLPLAFGHIAMNLRGLGAALPRRKTPSCHPSTKRNLTNGYATNAGEKQDGAFRHIDAKW